MNRRLSVLAFISFLASLPACTTLQSVSVTQIPSDRSRPIRAEESNTALFGIHFDNDFVDPLRDELVQQCPNGKVTGILTKHQNTSYFIVSTRKVIATGYCVYDGNAAPPPAPVEKGEGG
jgi:hypothetical protein